MNQEHSSLRLRRVPARSGWASTPVSSRSRFGDDVWHLDIHLPGRRPDQNRLSWDALLPDGSLLTDSQHAALLKAAKQHL